MQDPSGIAATTSTSQLSAEPKMGPLELFWLGKISAFEFNSRHSGNPLNGDQKQEMKGGLAASSLGKQAADSCSKPFHEQERMEVPASSSKEAEVKAADGSSPSQAADGSSEESSEPSTLSKRARFKLEKGYDKPRAGKCQDYYAWLWQRPKNKYNDH